MDGSMGRTEGVHPHACQAAGKGRVSSVPLTHSFLPVVLRSGEGAARLRVTVLGHRWELVPAAQAGPFLREEGCRPLPHRIAGSLSLQAEALVMGDGFPSPVSLFLVAVS